MRKLLVALALATASIAGMAGAQAAPDAHGSAQAAPVHVDPETYKAALAKERRKYFADAMSGLTAPQLETFWSVFTDFEREKTALVEARVELIRSYSDAFTSAYGLSDADTTKAVHEMAALQRHLVDLREKYYDIYARRIDAKTAARFALVDDYVATSIRMDWLKQIPFPGDEKP